MFVIMSVTTYIIIIVVVGDQAGKKSLPSSVATLFVLRQRSKLSSLYFNVAIPLFSICNVSLIYEGRPGISNLFAFCSDAYIILTFWSYFLLMSDSGVSTAVLRQVVHRLDFVLFHARSQLRTCSTCSRLLFIPLLSFTTWEKKSLTTGGKCLRHGASLPSRLLSLLGLSAALE